MNKIRIFLTGGSGMVGRNLLESPLAKKFEISAPPSSELNLCDYQATLEHIRNFKPDVIVHAAGRVGGIQANVDSPLSFLVENLDMGRNVVMSAREAGVKQLMNLGSSCMYPRNLDRPISESEILQGELEPTNEGYALAKIAVAKMCTYVNAQDERFHYKTIIPCNLFGPYDKFDPGVSHLIPAIITKVHEAKVNKQPFVEIWGDGSARREFMFASELVDFIWNAIDNVPALPDIINVGLGEDHTVLQYYETVANIVGWKGDFSFDLLKPVGMQRKVVATDLLDQFGWKASKPLSEGIRETYQYYLDHVVEKAR